MAAAERDGWLGEARALAGLEPAARARLEGLEPVALDPGAVLFSPGEAVQGYVIVLEGRVSVSLIGPNGREIVLYEVAPGQSCIQSTLGLLGGDPYSAEARTTLPTRLVVVPRAVFLGLVEDSPFFRKLVFTAFAERMQSMMQLIEAVSFLRIEERLAQLILARADATGHLAMTQAEMARAIGSAREVVSRRLERMSREGLVSHDRGSVVIRDRAALERLAARPAL